MINDLTYVRRCNECDYSDVLDLPDPQKKIIYLDQFAISSLVKVGLGRAGPVWQRVRHSLDKAIRAQAIICPHSEIHKSESVLSSKLKDQLKDLYRQISLNRSFRSPLEIQQHHIREALKLFELDSPYSTWPRWRYILEDSPNIWNPDFFVTVKTDFVSNRADTARKVKQDLLRQLAITNPIFRASENTFEQQYALEVHQAAKNIAILFKNDIKLIADAQTSEDRAWAFLRGSAYSDIMRLILRYFEKRGYRGVQVYEKAAVFLVSPRFEEMPHIRTSAAIWAGLIREVHYGAPDVSPSDFNDVEAISHYAPYCDAMLIDNRMRNLLTTNPVKDKIRLTTSFFSSKTLEDFIAYLDCITDAVSEPVAKAVRDIY
jgi:hypothetical protein